MGKSKELNIDDITKELDQGQVSNADGFSSSTALCYFSYAAVVSFLPAYLFWTVFDFSNFPVALGVTLVSALLLTLGYRNVATSTRTRLVQEVNQGAAGKKGAAKSSGSNDAVQQSITSQASNWAFFWNNAVFAVLFVFLAFYALAGVDLTYRFVVSTSVSSFLVWQLSSN